MRWGLSLVVNSSPSFPRSQYDEVVLEELHQLVDRHVVVACEVLDDLHLLALAGIAASFAQSLEAI